MKSLNRKEVLISYITFTEYMIFLVMASLVCVFTFFKTSSVEISKIQTVGNENQQIFDEQMLLSNQFEDFFKTYQSIDLIQENNVPFLMNNIATKKMDIKSSLQRIPKKDALTYNYIIEKSESFLRTRDSINALKIKENTYKNDVIRCSEESRVITRQMRVGNLSYDR
jgi:hypothetical protein